MISSIITQTASFNPRSREGSDSFFSVLEFDIPSFNPRSREGSDLPQVLVSVGLETFQSTLP